VSQHDFIFSNHWRHRIARHAAFVFACWIFFLITFYLPIKVFPGWDTDGFAGNVARIGLSRWVWLRLINSIFIFLPLLAFAYSVIYFLLPRYFFDKKNRVITTVMFAGIFIGVLLLQYFSGWLVAANWVSANPAVRKMPVPGSIINTNMNIILFNYPIVAGFAVIIKMMKRSWLKQQETLQIAREKANAELQLLKAQIHPHFLFNTLNNIYFFTLTASQKAPEILTKLTDILRYILNECNQPLVPLVKELKMIEDYMALERIRYGDRLKMELEISGDCSHKMIPPLLLIPLVENSFKHGASKMLAQPWINLTITIKEQSLYFILSNSRPDEIIPSQHTVHIGLNNVKKRLQLLYPSAHELNIAESTNSFEVFMKIRLEETNVIEKDIKSETIEYAVA
jgi:sensor histidine kinase YesM